MDFDCFVSKQERMNKYYFLLTFKLFHFVCSSPELIRYPKLMPLDHFCSSVDVGRVITRNMRSEQNLDELSKTFINDHAFGSGEIMSVICYCRLDDLFIHSFFIFIFILIYLPMVPPSIEEDCFIGGRA